MKTILNRKEIIKILYNDDLINRCNTDFKTIDAIKEDRDFYCFVSSLSHKELNRMIIEILIRENKTLNNE